MALRKIANSSTSASFCLFLVFSKQMQTIQSLQQLTNLFRCGVGLTLLNCFLKWSENVLCWLNYTLINGAWIAEWYHTWLWSSVSCAMPWAVSLRLGDDKLLFRPNHSIYTLFMIPFGWFDTIIVSQICHVNCETENWK